jgi:hypothetical protein
MSKVKQLSFQLGLDALPAEAMDPATYAELIKIYNSIHTLATTLDAVTGPLPVHLSDRAYVSPVETVKLQNIARVYPQAAEDLAQGNVIYITSGGLAAKAVADTFHNKKCRGIVQQAVNAGSYAEVVTCGVISGFVGLTPGQDFFLSTTAGVMSNVGPAAGNTLQFLGYAISSTQIYFNPEMRHSVV